VSVAQAVCWMACERVAEKRKVWQVGGCAR
jgi:hypothetical protein